MLDLTTIKQSRLTAKEKALLDKHLRASKRKPPKSNLKNIPARDQCQTPPYAILPLLPYLPKEWIVWESAASKHGFLGEAIRALNGNTVIETGIELDGTDYLKAIPRGDVEVTNTPYSIKFDWLERAYDNRKPFAFLLPFDTWAAARAQNLFQRFGMQIIILNRRVHFHMPNLGWGDFDENGEPAKVWDQDKKKWVTHISRSDYSVAWFTWGLYGLKEPVTYGYIPLEKQLPRWMVRPNHKNEITNGVKSVDDRLAIRHATEVYEWPKGGRRK